MHKIEVPYIDQSVKYPTGCESVSAVMLLKYLGYEITVDEFIKNCLECRDMEMRDGFGVGSNTVNIEQLYQSESFYTSGSSGYLVYFIEAHERWNNYTGYLTFRVTCDEWGELSWGVSYRSNS